MNQSFHDLLHDFEVTSSGCFLNMSETASLFHLNVQLFLMASKINQKSIFEEESMYEEEHSCKFRRV